MLSQQFLSGKIGATLFYNPAPAHRFPPRSDQPKVWAELVTPGRAQREPGIHRAAIQAEKWIPGSPLRDAPE